MSSELSVLIDSLNKEADAECQKRLNALCEKIQQELVSLTGLNVNYDSRNFMSEEETRFQYKNPLMVFIRARAISGCSGVDSELYSWQEIAKLHRAHFIRKFIEKTAMRQPSDKDQK